MSALPDLELLAGDRVVGSGEHRSQIGGMTGRAGSVMYQYLLFHKILPFQLITGRPAVCVEVPGQEGQGDKA
jgi:hypothetical protein